MATLEIKIKFLGIPDEPEPRPLNNPTWYPSTTFPNSLPEYAPQTGTIPAAMYIYHDIPQPISAGTGDTVVSRDV
jgi:hypothetical protein